MHNLLLLDCRPILTALSLLDVRERSSRLDFTPSNQSPVLVDTSAQGNLLALLGARRRGKSDRDISSLDGQNGPSRLRSSNVDEQRLANDQLGHLGLFAVVRLDTE